MGVEGRALYEIWIELKEVINMKFFEIVEEEFASSA